MKRRHDPLAALLLASGAVSGPYRRTRPLTLSRWARVVRAVRGWINARRSPL